MADNTTTGKPIIFDGWRSISTSLYMALAGYTVMVSVPVLSTAAVEMLGFTEEQVGRVWGADLGGFSLGAVIAALLVARVNRRYLVMAGIVLSIAANTLCFFYVEYEQVMWLRVVMWPQPVPMVVCAYKRKCPDTGPARPGPYCH